MGVRATWRLGKDVIEEFPAASGLGDGDTMRAVVGREAAGGADSDAGSMGGRASSAFAVDDATLGQVVGGDLYGHPVAGDDSDEVLSHLAGDVGEDAMAVLQLNHELGIGKGLDDASFGANRFFFGHTTLLSMRHVGRMRTGRSVDTTSSTAGHGQVRSVRPRRWERPEDSTAVGTRSPRTDPAEDPF